MPLIKKRGPILFEAADTLHHRFGISIRQVSTCDVNQNVLVSDLISFESWELGDTDSQVLPIVHGVSPIGDVLNAWGPYTKMVDIPVLGGSSQSASRS